MPGDRTSGIQSAWQSETQVSPMSYDRHSHSVAPIPLNGPHDASASSIIRPVAVVEAVDAWFLTSTGSCDFGFIENETPGNSPSLALWSNIQEPHHAAGCCNYGTCELQNDPQCGGCPSLFYLSHNSGQPDYSPVTPLGSTFAYTDPFPSPSPSLSSTLSVDLDTVGEDVEPRIPGTVKNVVGSHKIAAAAYKRRSRETRFICPYHENGCEAEFTARHNLEYHINSHTGRKPYKCKKGCPYAAPSPATVRRHEKGCQGR